ncbi:hypothetical protein FSP39_008772 [Pinctada imbricata]|uniref:Transcription elongation factor A N-terminal and central domain-containing protein 2 n=1 Tax=Pinctada imbricata TaxID=66713 RepID=A0AA88YEC7_PINIB|nr:hypothetical protein FSP39_008772 [Pinctada imbricata]
MDKFVIKKPRDNSSYSEKSSGKPALRQSTIESLQGVVVVEEIWRAKAKLKLSTTTPDQMVECLEKLGKKVPSRKVMLETKIGRVINKLRRHENEAVQKAAQRVYVKWKTHFKDHLERPQIEVKCDLKTENMRNSAKKMLADALSLEASSALPEVIEREVFYVHKRLINHAYRRTMRAVVFALRHNEDVKNQVLDSSFTVSDFVKSYVKD